VQLLQDPDLRSALGARARRFIVGHWSWEAHFNELERELVRLVETQRAGNGK
jgi:glycosyltransferase involved in cell wall biosynthesis